MIFDMQRNIVIKSIQDDRTIISIFDIVQLKRYLMVHVAQEYSNLVEPCYYPKVSMIFKDLLAIANTTEEKLRQYSLEKYGPQRESFKIVHDPYTTLLVLFVQEFLKNNDYSGAQAAFDLFALRTYSNTLHKFTTPKGSNRQPICINDVFQSALESLSLNHIFKKKKTISSSIAYFSRDILMKYKRFLEEDDSNRIFNMIYSLKNRIKQSVKSLMVKYYDIYKNKSSNKTKDEEVYDTTHETRLRAFIDRVSEDMCVYRKKNNVALQMATQLTKFNRHYSVDYVNSLAQPRFSDDIKLAYYLLLKDLPDFSIIKQNKFLDYIKTKLSIKSTKQQVYFKKAVNDIQMKVIDDLNMNDWYSNLTIQSKAVSRNFIAYYLALYLRYYV